MLVLLVRDTDAFVSFGSVTTNNVNLIGLTPVCSLGKRRG